MNGNTISSSTVDKLFEVSSGITFTVEDNSNGKSGKIENTNTDSNSKAIYNNGGTVEINGGTISGYNAAIFNSIGTVKINGGTVSGDKYAIYNGIGNVKIIGGTFNQDVSKYLSDGYSATSNNDGTWTVTSPVCEINGTDYYNLEEALEAAANGDTVKLKADTGLVATTVSIARTITLDLNGHTISKASNGNLFEVLNNGNLTVKYSSATKTGKIENTYTNGTTISNNGTLTIENGTIASKSTAIKNIGTLTIENGIFDNDVINDKDKENLLIKGGKFKKKAYRRYLYNRDWEKIL